MTNAGRRLLMATGFPLVALGAFLMLRPALLAQEATDVGLGSPNSLFRDAQRLPVGVNLDFVLDYSSEVPFVDLFRTARSWIPQQEGAEWGQGPPLRLDEHGWVTQLDPGQYASTLLCCERGVPAGRYTCLYDGKGRLEFEGSARVLRERPGRLIVQIEPPGECLVHLRETDAADPLRNIRVIMPKSLKRYIHRPFNPTFLKGKAAFSVLRFKDWQKTDDSEIATWDQQPDDQSATQANGVAVSLMTRLANELKADPWFSMPHMADDDYVRRFALAVKETLDPDRRIYVEYTNEAWNTIFTQNAYVREKGAELKLPGDHYHAGLHFYSQRAVEVFNIWTDVFGGNERLVRVMGGQADNPWVSEQVLQYKDAWKSTDALAIAPYFGHEFGTPENAEKADSLTVDDVLEHCENDLPRLRRDVEENAANAKRFQVPMIAYEGGQHLWAMHEAVHNESFTELLIAANRHPRMKQLYLHHLGDWKAAGGQLYIHYKSVGAPGQYGCWGLQEYEGQELSETPKLQAVYEFYRENPRWWP